MMPRSQKPGHGTDDADIAAQQQQRNAMAEGVMRLAKAYGWLGCGDPVLYLAERLQSRDDAQSDSAAYEQRQSDAYAAAAFHARVMSRKSGEPVERY